MVYKAIKENSAFENDYRLKDQSIGAAISVMGNIPEGFVRRSNKEFTQFLFVSISSAAELESHKYVALDQGYIMEDTFNGIYQQVEKTSKMVSGLITYLLSNQRKFKQNRQKKPEKPNKQ
jgi:four helix bundle protein